MIDVTCAIIRNEENEVLVVQKGEKTNHPFKWEFPGGKLKEDETEEECIIREIREELAMEIVICKRLASTEYDYGNKQIRLIPFVCDTLDDLPFLSEHIAYRWIDQAAMKTVDFSEADIIVAEAYLVEYQSAEVHNDRVSELDYESGNEEDLKSMVSNIMGTREAEWIAESAVGNSKILKKLVDYSFSIDKKLAFRASWILSKVFDKYPDILGPDIPLLISSIESLDNESVQRSFLRIISLSDLSLLNQRYHGILADHCFNMLKSGSSAIAIKAYSLEIIYKLALIYPGLANELSSTINILQGERSAGILARCHIILKKLAGTSKDR